MNTITFGLGLLRLFDAQKDEHPAARDAERMSRRATR
jgi:hypothetical protein